MRPRFAVESASIGVHRRFQSSSLLQLQFLAAFAPLRDPFPVRCVHRRFPSSSLLAVLCAVAISLAPVPPPQATRRREPRNREALGFIGTVSLAKSIRRAKSIGLAKVGAFAKAGALVGTTGSGRLCG